MRKLSYPVSSASLRNITHPQPVISSITRCSPTVNMLKRYTRLKSPFNDLYIDDFDGLLPNIRENRTIESLCNKLERVDEVIKSSTTGGYYSC